jgi:hypothetical protein
MSLAPVQAARRAAMVGVCACFAFVATPSHAGFNTFSVGGDATTASIQPTLDAFRAALGGPNNGNNPGPLAGGRREIDWDGGGAVTAALSGPILAAFQNTRGATFTTPGTGFLQTPVGAPELAALNPTYATAFAAFSPQRIFVPVASNVTDVLFSLPGSGGATPATVTGFGAIFTDVDLAGLTRMEFFAPNGNLLETFVAPVGTVANASQSFLGGIADDGERIARVRITTGNSPLGPNDDPLNLVDVVAMDDFLYSEPTAIPEPSAASLLLMPLVGALASSGRRRGCHWHRQCFGCHWLCQCRSPQQINRSKSLTT